jgi:hypothetical protein
MQRCHFCGFEFPDNTRFCGNCGRAPAPLTSFNPASPPIASPPEAYINTIANTSLPLGNWPDEEERRRRSILPVPLPFGTNGPPAGGQIPMVQGTPSFGGVPYVQGTTPGMSGSVPPSNLAASPASVPSAAPTAGQPAGFGPQSPPWSSQPAQYPAHPTGIPDHQPPEQDHPGKHHHHHREHREQHAHQNAHVASTASKGATGGIAKVILIAIIGVVVVAGGASALAFALHSHLPSLASIIQTTSNNSSTISSNRNANATACAASPGIPCAGTTSPSSPVASGNSTGTFSFSGAVSGVMVITSFPVCAFLQGNTYSLQVIGTIGGTQYKFIIGLLSYKGPGTYTSQLTVNLIRGSGASVGVLGNDGRLPVSISIINGGKAGTVNSDLEGILKLGEVQLSKGHISANWTCG